MTYRHTLHHDPGYLMDYLGRVLRGWANYFRHGVSKADLQRGRLLRVGADHELAAEEAPHRLARTPAQVLPARHLAPGPRRATVPWRRHRHGHSVPLPRLPHPDPVDTINHTAIGGSSLPWRARCGESRTAGSAGGPGKRSGSNAATAPRADPTGATPGAADKYVTVIIDLTGIRDGTGPRPAARHGPGPLRQGLRRLARRPAANAFTRRRSSIATLDPFRGYATPSATSSPTRSPCWTPSTSSGCAMRRCVCERG